MGPPPSPSQWTTAVIPRAPRRGWLSYCCPHGIHREGCWRYDQSILFPAQHTPPLASSPFQPNDSIRPNLSTPPRLQPASAKGHPAHPAIGLRNLSYDKLKRIPSGCSIYFAVDATSIPTSSSRPRQVQPSGRHQRHQQAFAVRAADLVYCICSIAPHGQDLDGMLIVMNLALLTLYPLPAEHSSRLMLEPSWLLLI